MNTNTLTNKKQALLEAIANKRKKPADEGFSLIELIVVVLVIGIIAAIAIPVFLNAQENARVSATEATAANALTSATAALHDDEEDPSTAVQMIQNQQDEDSEGNPVIEVTLSQGDANSIDVDDLCVHAQHTQGGEYEYETGPHTDCGLDGGSDD